jgi:hypothetical protein
MRSVPRFRAWLTHSLARHGDSWLWLEDLWVTGPCGPVRADTISKPLPIIPDHDHR